MTAVFVTGMLRSGTTLGQTLLTNHPDALVAYQPFHQLYVDTKQLFLDEAGLKQALPLDDGVLQANDMSERFTAWLGRRRFSHAEAVGLFARATAGKGGGLPSLRIQPKRGGSFAELLEEAHLTMASALGRAAPPVLGSKEILCEEFVPHLVDSGTRCLLVIRDPRAVVASAGLGAYRRAVGDRYPFRLLLGLWRKSARYWLRYRRDPAVLTIRYEDLVQSPAKTLSVATAWLGLPAFSPEILVAPLLDHAGKRWSGNSSFGTQVGIDAGSLDRWQTLLGDREARFIAACARREMDAIGYPVPADIAVADITSFQEDVADVRPAYLRRYPFDAEAKASEVARFTSVPATGEQALDRRRPA